MTRSWRRKEKKLQAQLEHARAVEVAVAAKRVEMQAKGLMTAGAISRACRKLRTKLSKLP